MDISCPKCGSHDLIADKKGFSGKKAVAGAVLTGGIGLLAGTIGSNKIIITCLKCGKQFRPGQGRVALPPLDIKDPKEKKILEIVREQGKLQAVKYCKQENGVDLATANQYVDELMAFHQIKAPFQAGCVPVALFLLAIIAVVVLLFLLLR